MVKRPEVGKEVHRCLKFAYMMDAYTLLQVSSITLNVNKHYFSKNRLFKYVKPMCRTLEEFLK